MKRSTFKPAIWLAMLGEDADTLLENALEELRLRGALPPEPSTYLQQHGMDSLQEVREIIHVRLDLLNQERTAIIGKYE